MLHRLLSSRALFALCLSILALTAFAVRSEAQRTNDGLVSAGRDYWIAFMPNYLTPATNVRIFVASGTPNRVDVDIYGGTKEPNQHFTQTMKADDIWTLTLPNPDLGETRITETPQYRAIHVYSQNPVAVYGFSNVSTTTDSYLALPTPGLGNEYYTSCFYDDNYIQLSPSLSEPLAGEFVIIAPYDNTEVTIGPVRSDTRVDPQGNLAHAKGDTWTVKLDKGQTYLVQSTGLNIGDADPTGTHIVSSKPVGLISGHQRTRIPVDGIGNSKDHIMEMIPPLDKWGTEYYDMPQGGRPGCGNYIRLIAGEDGVSITENGQGIAQLNHAGDFVDRELVLDPVVYKSNGKKFMTVEHSYSGQYNGDPSPNADPFSIVMTPKNQFQRKMIFRVPNNVAAGTQYENFGTFICPKDSIYSIMISTNGAQPKRIVAYQFAGYCDSFYSTTPAMAAYRIKFPSNTATYIATCGSPFACYIYGFSYAESYGHPAGMALNLVSPDTLPPLEARDSLCGTFKVQLYELRHIPKFSFEDTKIAEVSMITEANDVRWDLPSSNYVFAFDNDHPFTPGDSIAYYTLTVLDPSKDAYAAVWTTDRAGNDTVYEYHYYAPKLTATPRPTYFFEPVRVTLDSCRTITIHNAGAQGELTVTNALIQGSAVAGKFKVTPEIKDQQLKAGDSLVLQVCYTPSDTLPESRASEDTLIVTTGCVPFRFALEGFGVTPLIVADDKDFGNVAVGDVTAPTPVKIHNVGKWPLEIKKGWTLLDPTNFTFVDDAKLPLTIPAHGDVTLNFTFHPTATGPFRTRQDWATDLIDPFMHQIRDTSVLTGFGIAPGLNWDRPKEAFYTECSTPSIHHVNLINPSGGSTGTGIDIDSVVISGPNANEFSVVGNSLNQPLPWNLDAGGQITVDVQFSPNITSGYANRSAKITAYGSTADHKLLSPEMDLAGTVRHSTIRITPPSHSFGLVDPGTPLTTDYWIHNDGDTALILTNLAIDQGFTLSGFTSPLTILPGDSAMVTLSTNAVIGTTLGTLSAAQTTPCNASATATAQYRSSTVDALGTGHDFQDMFVCQSGSTSIEASNPSSKDIKLVSIEIQEAGGTQQFTFADGKQLLVEQNGGKLLVTDAKSQYPVNYKPVIGGQGATIIYTFKQADNDSVFTRTATLAGNPLHYASTLSVKRPDGNGVYAAYARDVVNVPVQMTSTLDAKAQITGVNFDVRYKRDEFIASQPANETSLNVTNFTTTVDPTDKTYEIAHVEMRSTNPISQMSPITHMPLEYVITKETASDVEIRNFAVLDKDGNTACWVDLQQVPGTFQGADRCGDGTIRNWINGIPPAGIGSVTPNPVGSSGSVEYQVAVSGSAVTLEVYDLLGQKALSVVNGVVQEKGAYTANFDTSNLPNGTYVIRFSSNDKVLSRRFVVQK